ncbi:MAG: DNA polymerase III subunit delta [Elusimicrobia bacterium GWC2_51_8]|nr:MAG: DNA polymerase III subunit delta [Elusimicrobia bacterium GWA2_51_34]OGR60273.1 MAG: DNA polymerase III subunit delta [Elusimicrobia bacterium GWC2_51_8]OGR86103.1 MAG: DNA polymerase III subunit delta [Elusimicrobia bacterium GWF2_52_66]HCE98684.1 DNA polymerase III subunit delta [Elusimicrobiota bacterium]
MQTLTPQAMEEEWRKNKLRPVYYFCGEEHALQEAALARLKALFKPNAFDFSVHYAETADMREIAGEAQTAPMLSERRFLVIKRCDKLKKDNARELAAYLENPAPFTSLFIISSKKYEASDQFAKALAQDCALVIFECLNDFEARKFLGQKLETAGCAASDEALETLTELLGTDAGTLAVEAEKIALYHHGVKKPFGASDAVELAGFSKNQNPFDLPNAVCKRDAQAGAVILDKLLAEDAEPLVLLYNVSRTLERLLKVKRLEASGAGSSASYQTGVSPGQYRHLSAAAGAYSEDKLLRGLKRCMETEALLKSSSGRNPALLIRQLVYEILRFK